MTPQTLAVLLGDLLQSVLDAYTDADGTPPQRQFITHGALGTANWQGEQLTVGWTSFKPVAPFPLTQQRAPKTNVVPAVDLIVEVVRSCWPQPNVQQPGASLPSPQSITDASLALAVDAATVGSWLQRLSVEGGMFPSYPMINTSQDVRVGELVPTGPQSMLAGIRFAVQVELVIP